MNENSKYVPSLTLDPNGAAAQAAPSAQAVGQTAAEAVKAGWPAFPFGN